MGGMKTLALFALLGSVAFANPAPAPVAGVILQESSGYLVKAELIQHYTLLCRRYPAMGDKPGDGVFVIDEGLFHLDPKNYNDYVVMLQREQRGEK
jgi:hypothetical protein